jgi:preprotein translocase subunit SecG
MFKTLLVIALVVAVLLGGMLALRSSKRLGMPSDEVLKRAAKRSGEQADEDKDRD